jgi:ribosomal protein L4
MTSSESEEHAQQSRKRSRRSNSGENGAGKKTRGRPRVDTQDATAADVSGYFFPLPQTDTDPVQRGLVQEVC